MSSESDQSESDRWQKIGDVVDRITGRIAPVMFIVHLDGALAVSVMAEAMRSGNKPETIIAESVRAYLGDAGQ